jgi:DNA polymerase III delta prime subunit
MSPSNVMLIEEYRDEKGLNTICDYTDRDLRYAINVLQTTASSLKLHFHFFLPIL